MWLQEMGGWESIEVVRRYAHLAPNHLTQHVMQIDAFLAGNGTRSFCWTGEYCVKPRGCWCDNRNQ